MRGRSSYYPHTMKSVLSVQRTDIVVYVICYILYKVTRNICDFCLRRTHFKFLNFRVRRAKPMTIQRNQLKIWIHNGGAFGLPGRFEEEYQDPGPGGLNNGLPYGSNLSHCTLFVKNIVLRNKYNVSGRKAQFSSKDEISPGNG